MNGERPTVVTVFGVANIAWGGLGLFLGGLGLLGLVVSLGPTAQENPGAQAMRDNPVLMGWSIFNSATMLVFSMLLIVAGFGLLCLKPWGRAASLVYGVYGILKTLVGAVVSFLVVLPAMSRAMEQVSGQFGEAFKGGMIFGVGLSAMVGLAYPACLLYFMTRKDFRAAFAQPQESPPQ